MKDTMFFPKAIRDFNCLAGGCEDNCCRNFVRSLNIEPDALQKYKNVSGEFGEKIMNAIDETGEVARFKATPGGNCAMLDEFGFCSIQMEMGHDYLCDFCKMFPRISGDFNGGYETSLALSCPEAVRTLLFGKAPYELVFIPFENKKNNTIEPFEQEEYKIRFMLLEITRRTDLTIMDKLALMGLFMRSLSKIPRDSNFTKEVDTVVAAYNKQLSTPGLTSNIHKNLVNTNTAQRLDHIKQLMQMAGSVAAAHKDIPETSENTHFYELLKNFNTDETDFDRLIVPYINNNEIVFVNYLMYILHETKLAKGAEDYAVSYSGFVGEFITLLLFTSGMFHKNDTLTNEEMTAAIYLFHRKIEPHPDFRKEIQKVFYTVDLATLLSLLGDVK